MQEQTARLHQQYLEGQETAQKSIQSLLEQQQRLMSGQVRHQQYANRNNSKSN